ncbi:MAG TPA: protein kinase [Candidatus Eremiobacteraeota bacterium]|nr:MAG: Serine/threonine-protein kinase PknB [bacterium ADurb.Bin363]HPZ07592.1 protein kinase [Candidatus Eremiobacteraeota bacterium]
MTEIFTLMALGAAFGWIFAKVIEDPPGQNWPVIKVEEFPEEKRIRRKIQEAENNLNKGKYFEGLNLFRELRQELKDYKDKFSTAEKIGIDSSIKLCLEQLSESLIKQKVYTQALPLLKEACTLFPEDINLLKKMVRLNLALEQKEEAIINLEKILTLDPLFLDGYRRLGKLYMETNQREKAIKIFQESMSNFPGEPRVRLEMLERITLSTPEGHSTKLTALKAWAEELLKDKNLSKAEEVLQESLKIFPENNLLTVELSKIQYKLGKMDTVREQLEKINYQNNLEAKFYLASTYLLKNEPDRALKLFNQIIKFEREISELTQQEKIKRLQSVEIPGENDAEITGAYHSILFPALGGAGEIYRKRGMIEEAEKLFTELLQKGSTFIDEKILNYFSDLSKDFAKIQDEREHYWKKQTSNIEIIINKKKEQKDSYEDFWLKFKPVEPTPSDIIGEGGMAVVYRGIEVKTGRKVAIKKMHRQFCLDPKARSFFHNEVSALESLSRPQPHPNIVEFISHGISEDRFVFAMELVEGKSLRDKLIEGEIKSLKEIYSIVCQICTGLERAHEDEKKIVHRDLKPENILIRNDGIVKLTDFGICRVSSLTTSTRQHYQRTRSFVGTSYYSAPEQYPDPFDGRMPPIDHRADIYSLGCIIYELLTTQTPFVHDDPGIVGLMHQRRSLSGSSPQNIIPPGIRNPLLMEKLGLNNEQKAILDKIVMKCLQKLPLARYQSVKELREEFVKVKSEEK